MIDETIMKRRNIAKFMYNHVCVLSLIRQDFIKGNYLYCLDITRFDNFKHTMFI